MILYNVQRMFSTVVTFIYLLLKNIFPSSDNSFLSASLSQDSNFCCYSMMVSLKSCCLFSDSFIAFNCVFCKSTRSSQEVVFLFDSFRFAGYFEVSTEYFLLTNSIAISDKIQAKHRKVIS